MLTSGACHVNAWTFFVTLAGVRALRFAAEGGLAAHYGRGILGWMQSTAFAVTVGVMTGIAIIGTIVSAVAVYRTTKRSSPTGGPDPSVRDRDQRTKRVKS